MEKEIIKPFNLKKMDIKTIEKLIVAKNNYNKQYNFYLNLYKNYSLELLKNLNKLLVDKKQQLKTNCSFDYIEHSFNTNNIDLKAINNYYNYNKDLLISLNTFDLNHYYNLHINSFLNDDCVFSVDEFTEIKEYLNIELQKDLIKINNELNLLFENDLKFLYSQNQKNRQIENINKILYSLNISKKNIKNIENKPIYNTDLYQLKHFNHITNNIKIVLSSFCCNRIQRRHYYIYIINTELINNIKNLVFKNLNLQNLLTNEF